METSVFSLFSLFPNIKLKRAGEGRKDIRGHLGVDVTLRLLESEIWAMGRLQTSAPHLLKVGVGEGEGRKERVKRRRSITHLSLSLSPDSLSAYFFDSLFGHFGGAECK